MGDLALIIIYSCILFVSITLNLTLLLLISIATPHGNRNFSIFMIAHALFHVLITVSTFSNMGRILVLDSHLVWIMHGPCGLVSTQVCYLAFDGYLTGVSAVFYINMAAFLGRLCILRNGKISKKRVFLLLLIVVAPHVTAMAILFSTAQIPDSEARQLVKDNVPQYSDEATILASAHILSPPIAYTLCYTCVVIYPAMGILWKLRATLISETAIKHKEGRISSQTRALHQTFVKVLTYQALVPLIFVLSASLFMAVQWAEWREPVAESVPMMIAETPAILSAVISLTCIPSYKRYLRHKLFRSPPHSSLTVIVRRDSSPLSMTSVSVSTPTTSPGYAAFSTTFNEYGRRSVYEEPTIVPRSLYKRM